MTNMEKQLQQHLESVIAEAKDKLKEIVDDTFGDIYTSHLPYIEHDTTMNIGFIVQEIINNILAGKFTKYGSLATVKDSNGISFSFYIDSYQSFIKPIVDVFGEELKDARIKQLETELDTIKSMYARWGG